MRRVLPALLVLAALAALAACGGGASDEEAGPAASGSDALPSTSAELVTPSGFETVLVRAVLPDGTVCESCMWLAESEAERARGLMGVTGLGEHDGMVFRYDDEGHRSFWMKNTLVPLSIAFSDDEGRVIDAADMTPCLADPCPSYGAAEPFQLAIEVAQGRLAELGLTVGAVVSLGGPCPS